MVLNDFIKSIKWLIPTEFDSGLNKSWNNRVRSRRYVECCNRKRTTL